MERTKNKATPPIMAFEDSDFDKTEFMSVSMRIEKEWRVVTYRSVGLDCTVFMFVHIPKADKKHPFVTYELDGVCYDSKMDLLIAMNKKGYGKKED